MHNEEIESLKSKYEHQMKLLRERLEHEEHRRKKAQEELQTLNVSTSFITGFYITLIIN